MSIGFSFAHLQHRHLSNRIPKIIKGFVYEILDYQSRFPFESILIHKHTFILKKGLYHTNFIFC